jgi:hypothetical protein
MFWSLIVTIFREDYIKNTVKITEVIQTDTVLKQKGTNVMDIDR